MKNNNKNQNQHQNIIETNHATPPNLFDSIIDFQNALFRNVPTRHSQKNVFADLSDDPEDWQEAREAVSQDRYYFNEDEYANKALFTYENAIQYVFNRSEWLKSRYGNGQYPVWYGACDAVTSCYETAYHWRYRFLAACGFDKLPQPVYAHRNIYQVQCHALLIDLREKCEYFPELISDKNYNEFTHSIGKRLSQEGHPGLLTISARYPKGEVAAIFQEKVLSQPELISKARYAILPNTNKILIEYEGQAFEMLL